MALFTSGFETEDNTFTIEWTGKSGSPVVNATFHHGSKGMECDNSEYSYKTIAGQTEVWVYFMMKMNTDAFNLIGYQLLGGGNAICESYVAANPYFRLRRFYPAQADYDGVYDYDTNWHSVQIHFKKHAVTGVYQDWIDGVALNDSGNLDTSGAPDVDTVRIGISYLYSACTANFDCVQVDTAYVSSDPYSGGAAARVASQRLLVGVGLAAKTPQFKLKSLRLPKLLPRVM